MSFLCWACDGTLTMVLSVVNTFHKFDTVIRIGDKSIKSICRKHLQNVTLPPSICLDIYWCWQCWDCMVSDEGMIDEFETVCEMRIGRGNWSIWWGPPPHLVTLSTTALPWPMLPQCEAGDYLLSLVTVNISSDAFGSVADFVWEAWSTTEIVSWCGGCKTHPACVPGWDRCL